MQRLIAQTLGQVQRHLLRLLVMTTTAEETYDIILGARVSKSMNEEILAEQQRISKMTGIKPSINEVVRMLLEKGLRSSNRKYKR